MSGTEWRRLAAIGATIGAVAAVFAWDGGVFSPGRLTEAKMMAAFRAAGAEPGFRRNHAKGMCGLGTFAANGAASALSRATLFRAGSMKVVARFALAGPMPFQPDAPTKVRSLALQFLPDRGQQWRTGMLDIPVFPLRTPAEFYRVLAATPPGAPGPNPAWMHAFVATHPETAAAGRLIGARPISSGFADDSFNSIDTFRLVSATGSTVPVRWSAVPEQPFRAAPKDEGDGNPNALFDDLAARTARASPLRWHLVLVIGQPGDPTADPTRPWPADRRRIDAGTITVDRVTSEDGGACTGVNYDPLVLPDGIEASDDPFPSARSAAYLRSFTLRAAVAKPPSAVTRRDIEAIANGEGHI